MKQYFFETGNKNTRIAINRLRKASYKVVTSNIGMQVTPVGYIKTTMVTIFDNGETSIADSIVKGFDYDSIFKN